MELYYYSQQKTTTETEIHKGPYSC